MDMFEVSLYKKITMDLKQIIKEMESDQELRREQNLTVEPRDI